MKKEASRISQKIRPIRLRSTEKNRPSKKEKRLRSQPIPEKEGYKFLGWYEGDVLVSEIVKGTQKDYNLTAKWEHGGIFTLSLEGEEAITLNDGSTGTRFTYKVIRTLPEGTQAISNPIYVYYRTINGTAYGSTVDIDIALDKYHFKHVGGENVYLTFASGDMEKTFTVEEWGAETTADAVASFNINNIDRYYDVELYKSIDTKGRYPEALVMQRHTEER